MLHFVPSDLPFFICFASHSMLIIVKDNKVFHGLERWLNFNNFEREVSEGENLGLVERLLTVIFLSSLGCCRTGIKKVSFHRTNITLQALTQGQQEASARWGQDLEASWRHLCTSTVKEQQGSHIPSRRSTCWWIIILSSCLKKKTKNKMVSVGKVWGCQ